MIASKFTWVKNQGKGHHSGLIGRYSDTWVIKKNSIGFNKVLQLQKISIASFASRLLIIVCLKYVGTKDYHYPKNKKIKNKEGIEAPKFKWTNGKLQRRKV